MKNRRYNQLVEMGVQLRGKWLAALKEQAAAEATCNDLMAEYHRGELRDYGNQLQALADVATELFNRRYEVYMEQVHEISSKRTKEQKEAIK